MTYKAATAYFAAAIVTAVGVAWNLKGDLGAIQQDVAVIKSELASGRHAEVMDGPAAEASAIVQIYPRVEALQKVAGDIDARLARVQEIVEKRRDATP